MKSLANVFFIICIWASLLCCNKGTPEQGSRPNVLFIAFDDLNDWQSCLSGHPQAYTPNIDRLAKKGVLFSNAHAAGTMCCPSRASVISGLRPSSTGIYKNTDTPLTLYKEKQTLNKHFKDNGYYVAGAGKILHRFYFEADQWDEYVGRHKDKGIIGNREHPQPESTTRVSGNIAWGAYESPDSLTFDRKTVDWVSERLHRKHDKPFFLACGIFRPHIPWFNPQRYFDQYPLEDLELPRIQNNDLEDIPMIGQFIANSISNYTLDDDLENIGGNAEHRLLEKDSLWDDAVRAYLASVSYADAQLGKLLDELEKSPYADNTIIVLWSDHGWHLGEKARWRKGTLWEEVTRVPLIIYTPDAENNRECQEAVSLLDIYPSLVELCGLPLVGGLEGESLVPLLKNPAAARQSPAISSLGPEYHAIRDDRYRYIHYGAGQEELYDHQTDPEEWVNLANDPAFEEVKAHLRTFVPKEAKAPLKGIYNKKNSAKK